MPCSPAFWEGIAMMKLLQAGIVTAVLVVASTTPRAAPPVADAAPFSTSKYGTPVTDDYHWMETPDSRPLASWMRSQNDFTRATLDSIPGRVGLLREVSAAEKLADL